LAYVSPEECLRLRVEPRGFEPLTSAVQRRPHTLLEFSGACKTPANTHISSVLLFPSVQEIYSGCCTVAAHLVLSISRSYASTIAMAASLGYPTDDLVTSGPDEESRLSLIRAQEPDILGLLYRLAALRGPSVTLDRQMDRGHCVGRYSDPVTLIWALRAVKSALLMRNIARHSVTVTGGTRPSQVGSPGTKTFLYFTGGRHVATLKR
jgi:hypothetical protein